MNFWKCQILLWCKPSSYGSISLTQTHVKIDYYERSSFQQVAIRQEGRNPWIVLPYKGYIWQSDDQVSITTGDNDLRLLRLSLEIFHTSYDVVCVFVVVVVVFVVFLLMISSISLKQKVNNIYL